MHWLGSVRRTHSLTLSHSLRERLRRSRTLTPGAQERAGFRAQRKSCFGFRYETSCSGKLRTYSHRNTVSSQNTLMQMVTIFFGIYLLKQSKQKQK